MYLTKIGVCVCVKLLMYIFTQIFNPHYIDNPI